VLEVMNTRARSRGFTLIELMVTLTILAVLVGIGVPSFRTFVENQKVKTGSFELMTAVMMARSEAIKRNATVTLTPTAGDAWASGWSVLLGTTKLHSQTMMDAVTITQMDADKAEIAPTAISFGPSGRPTGLPGGSRAYFKIASSAEVIKCVKLDASGVPASANGSC
jgi:type IV fimbrial biogenesis protein FimT